MHRKIFFIAGLLSIALLTGCGATKMTSMPIRFDAYAMRRYTNDKIYQQEKTPISTDMSVVYEAVQQGTGTPNSLIITRVPISSGAAAEEIIELNAQQLKQKLLNYKGTLPKKINVVCDDVRNT